MKHYTKIYYVTFLYSVITINQTFSQDVEDLPALITHEKSILYKSSEDADTTILHIDTENGRVGVNVTNPTQTLEVYGKVLIRGTDEAIAIKNEHPHSLWVHNGTVSEDLFLVNTKAWADYVFKDDYKLMDLNTLKTFIKNHKHLPGIPTTETIAKDGYSQHEINTKYLEKIEELVLYTIEQENRINELIALVEAQQQNIEEALKTTKEPNNIIKNNNKR